MVQQQCIVPGRDQVHCTRYSSLLYQRDQVQECIVPERDMLQQCIDNIVPGRDQVQECTRGYCGETTRHKVEEANVLSTVALIIIIIVVKAIIIVIIIVIVIIIEIL